MFSSVWAWVWNQRIADSREIYMIFGQLFVTITFSLRLCCHWQIENFGQEHRLGSLIFGGQQFDNFLHQSVWAWNSLRDHGVNNLWTYFIRRSVAEIQRRKKRWLCPEQTGQRQRHQQQSNKRTEHLAVDGREWSCVYGCPPDSQSPFFPIY